MNRLLIIYLAFLNVNSCITNDDPQTDESQLPSSGCCQDFLTSPETPFWYPNLEVTELSDAKELCESADGKWTASDCSTSGMIGGCHYQDTAIPYIQLYPASQFGNESEGLALNHCPQDGGVQWITEFK